MVRRVLTAAALCLMAGAATASCDDDGPPCEIAGGTYHIALPDAPAQGMPALIWLHGAGGSGAGVVREGGMGSAFRDRGFAVIGANGMEREGRFGTGWYFHPLREKRRDEVAFLRAVADDAAARFGIDRTNILLAGFSVGGSMTSYLACEDPGAFRAYAPVAGGFWRPHPEDCVGPVKLFHTHGWRDQTVPLEGRPLRSGQIYQGDIFVTLQIWRAENGCDLMRADTFDTDGPFWRRKWESCAEGTALELALHPGGHGIPPGWSEMVLDWFEALPED